MLPQRMLSLEDHSIHQGWMVGQWKLLRNQCFFSSFRLAQFCAWGRIRPKCNGLDGKPLTRCEFHAPDRVSSSLSMLSQASVVWTYDWIFSGKGSSLPCAKAIFCRQSTVLISSICEYAIPCPEWFSILISSILFAWEVPVVLQLRHYIMSWPKELIRCRTRWGYSVGTSVLPFMRV